MSYSIGEVAIATNIAISTALAAGTEEKVKNRNAARLAAFCIFLLSDGNGDIRVKETY